MEALSRRIVNTTLRRPEAVIGFLLQGQRTAGKTAILPPLFAIGLAILLCYESRIISTNYGAPPSAMLPGRQLIKGTRPGTKWSANLPPAGESQAVHRFETVDPCKRDANPSPASTLISERPWGSGPHRLDIL